MRALVKQTVTFVERYRLWERGASLVVAVSGGADSLALLDVLVQLKQKYDLTLRVAHVNYHMRGIDADRDEHMVRTLAKRYQIPCSVLHARKHPSDANLEARLRDIRYRFFERVRARSGAEAIVTAHTLNDQAETVLLHVLRGTGERGMHGILPMNERLARPFLMVRHRQTTEYCRRYGITFGEDRTNADISFTRNRIRHRLIPYLQRFFKTDIEAILARQAEVTALDWAEREYLYNFFVQHAEWIGSTTVTKQQWRRLLPIERALWVQVQLRLLHTGFSFAQTQELLKVLDQPSWKSFSGYIGGLKVLLENDTLSLTVSASEK